MLGSNASFDAPVEPVTLEGEYVRLEPLELSHVALLAEYAIDPDIWRYSSNVTDVASLTRYVEQAIEERERGVSLPFAQIERSTGRAAGSTRFGNIEPSHRKVEIGWTWLSKPFQRTALNTEAKLLLLTHAFETWGCNRVELKSNANNKQSRAAMERIGAKFEGVLRAHMITDTGEIRDTSYYSILKGEWPAVKKGLEGRLAARSGS